MNLHKLLLCLGGLALVSLAPAAGAASTDSSRASVANTKSVEFIGKKFELKFKDTDHPVRIAEYYPAKETPSDWFELVEFQIYPVHPDGNKPIDHARRTAQAFKQKYPQMQFALLTNHKTGEAMLDFFYPTSTRKEKDKSFLEYDAFKFFQDAGGTQTMSFHYAKNIEGPGTDRPMNSVIEDIKKTRAEIVPAMAKFPLYRQ